jgi:hypothetical protein
MAQLAQRVREAEAPLATAAALGPSLTLAFRL